jgi:hypothetical protein
MFKITMNFKYKFLSIFLLVGIFSNAGLAQEQIGVASAVNKNTTDLTLEQERKLIDAGYEIIQNHTIETDGIGRAQMLLLDGTAFSVGPNSSVVLDKFIYNPETAEGSLEVTARGLLRIVGGKVTKKQPALIRTNSATVGIRGGIGIVQTNGPQTNATFLYGTEMTVTPNCVDLDSFGDQCSPDYATTVTEPGFSVSVESEDSEPSEPVEVTEESLDALQEELEAPEEAPEEEPAAEETPAEETQEEESTTEETPAEETQADEGTSSEETTTEETPGEEVAPESTEPETEAPAEIETEVASDDAGDSTDIEVDEGLLDSSGVSDVSSDVAPEELGTAEEFEVAIELETVEADDANEDSTENVAEEVTETTQETTVEVAPIFVVEASDVVTSFDENTSEISLAQFAIVNPGEQNYTVTIEGEGSDAFTYNQETNSLEVIQELDHESQASVELTVTFTSDNGDIQEVAFALDVTDVDEAVVLAVEPVNTITEAAISSELIANQVNVSETVPAGTVVATFSATDPEGNALSYSLSGSGSDLMTVSETGEVTLTGDLDFEANSTLVVMLEISDGANITTEEITINVINDDEPATIAATLNASSFAENAAIGAAIASVDASDPEGSAVAFTLSGTGSDNFSIDASGNITLASGLDYETATSYELTVVADDGTYASTEVITISVADVNEAPTLSATVAFNAFLENTATGTTIATSSATDPEAGAISYSLSGTGSENFSVNSDGTVTLASGLDYETTTAYAITLTASDGANSVSETLTINVGDINEAPSLTNSLAASSFAENVATGTTIATASASDPEAQTITYSLSGTGSENFSVDSAGNITLSSALDYETATSYSLTLTASDGANSTSNTINISVDDVIELSIALASSSISLSETATSGTSVTTTTTTTDGNTAVSYSLSGTGSDNFAVSSDGTITTAASLDYETTTSYSLTLTATDGTNTVTENLTINVDDVTELSIALASSSISLSETATSGTSVTTTTTTTDGNTAVSYSLSGTGSDNFAVSSDGTITTAASLDYETTTSYSLTLTATDGTNTVTDNLTINITDVDLSLSASLASAAQSEGLSTGTTIATSSNSNAEGTVTYSLTDADNKFSIDSSTGEVTLANALDYETKTSHEFTITATDGVTTTSETFTLTVSDVDLTVTNTLAASGQAENISTGTSIMTASASGAEGTVSYSITDNDNKFTINSSTGEVTLANALDYETKTSHTFTVTATDGVTTVTEEFTLNVTDMTINTLAVTLANSGAALAESSSSGTSVGSSSISNPDSETVSYSLSGTGSNNFAVDSSGNVTTNATLDFETAQSYSLTLTATAGGNTTTDAFTVNVGNVEELESAVLRYSADYNSASRSGFSATATRGPSGSSLAAYTLEQVGTTNSTAITSVDDTSNNYVPVEINSGTALNWRYYFPIDTSGNGQFAFAPNSSALDGKYYSPLGTAVTTTIANADFLTAGRLEGAEYWFMTTDKSAASIDYNSALARASGTLIVYRNSVNYSRNGWNSAISAAGLDSATRSIDLPADISGYSLIVDYRISVSNKWSLTSEISNLATWLQTPGNTFVLLAGEQCCSAAQMLGYGNLLLDAVGGGEVGSASRDGTTDTENFDISSSVVSSLFSTLSGDQWICAGCGPKITQVSGSGVNLTPYLSFWSGSELGSDYNGNIFMSTDIEWQTNDIGQENQQLLDALADLPNQTGGSNTTSTYNLYEDQVTLAGEVYKDANFVSFTNGNKRVIAMAVIPLENFAASGSSNDYFIPNFVPKTLWSYGDVGHDYCLGVGNNASACNTYDNYYDFSSIALDSSDMLDTSRFNGSTNELPEGQSMWWQVLNPSGVGVGLWAQISLKDSYDGASGSTLRDDQQSLLNVVISNVDYRKNDTTRYSAGDTGLGMDGYHYWSYQGATNADNDGLGINYGTSPIECATSNDSGCFWGDSSNQPGGAMITSSDPYKSGSMTLGVNYNSNNDTFSTGSFNVSAVVQDVKPSSSSYADYASLSNFRSSDFYSSSATGYSGFFSGILEFDVSGTGNSQLSSIRSSSTLATFTFDATNDDVQVVRTFDHKCRTFK